VAAYLLLGHFQGCTKTIQIKYNRECFWEPYEARSVQPQAKIFSLEGKAKEKISDVSEANSKIIKQFLQDMEHGINVANGSKKGARSYIRLRTLRDRLIFLAKKFKEHFQLDSITKITEEQLCTFFTEMRNGIIKKKDGKSYKSTPDYINVFKSFWHWYIKIQKKEGREISDICTDLDTQREKG